MLMALYVLGKQVLRRDTGSCHLAHQPKLRALAPYEFGIKTVAHNCRLVVYTAAAKQAR